MSYIHLLSIFLLLHSATAQSPPSLPPLPPSPPQPLPPSPPQTPALSPVPLVSFAPSPTPLSQSPLSPTPASIDIVSILNKPGRFTSLIRLLKTTQVDDRISTLVSESKQGLTLLAPTDAAFSSLKSGTLNSLSVQQQVQLVLFHILNSYYPLSQFQSASNPLRTLAGDNGGSDYPLNVTTAAGGDSVKLTSGLVNAEVGKTVYSDGQLAVYQVDKVLLPPRIFAAKPPALAPAGQKKGGGSDGSGGSSGGAAVVEYSGSAASGRSKAVVWLGGMLVAALALFVASD